MLTSSKTVNTMIFSSLLLCFSCVAGCASSLSNNTTVAKVSDSTLHSGHTSEEVFDTARTTLEELGIVTAVNKGAGFIEGQIPPFGVRAEVKEGSSWITYSGIERLRSSWKQRKGDGQWYTTVEGELVFRKGARNLDDAINAWSDAIIIRLQAGNEQEKDQTPPNGS